MTVVDLHVREAGSGLPVVLLHAFPLSSAMWLEQRNDLADDFRIITPDLRGFGGSQLGYDEPSLDHLADDVAALLDTLELDRRAGRLSMGGYASMAFLRRHGERVAGCCWRHQGIRGRGGARANGIASPTLDGSGTTQVLLDDVLPGCG
jgi:pimeloyl-ACP methyl ester carboxylesterase